MYFCRKFILLSLLVLIPTINIAQKVGIVLSGGGASGLAHIGFIKALEENNIPIDYISGTSMGALVGALYASGYSTDQMEVLFSSEEFQLWTTGKINDQYIHYFKRTDDDASWIKLKISLDSLFETNLPTNIVNSTSLDFGLAEIFSPASSLSHQNFDSLFIPFRCNASDITSKKPVYFNSGDLSTAVRASISYPFVLNPIKINGKLLYDGGLYDNFPVSELCKSFEPDYILGSNVSFNFPEPHEDNLLSQVRSMMSYDTKYEIECEKGFIVEPKIPSASLLDFSNVEETIQLGYEATMNKIDSIKMFIPRRIDAKIVKNKREKYNALKPKLSIKKIEVLGLNNSETKFILKSIRYNKKFNFDFKDIESKILRLASDEKIMRIDPDLLYVDSLKGFILRLNVKKEKNLFISFGGNLSSRTVNEGFVAVQYNYLNRTPLTLYGNTYFGKFYSSGMGLAKLDIASFIPMQIHGLYTFNKWDYFQNSSILVEESAPSYLIQRENYGQFGLAFPIGYKGKIGVSGNAGDIIYEYYQDNEFTRFDTTDITDFTNTTGFIYFERNSLNRKQYANAGNKIFIKASYTNGEEKTTPGGSSLSDTVVKLHHEWYRLKGHYDQYFNGGRKFKYGFMLEGLYSNQPFFSNYASTLLSSPGFEPIPESKTIFRSKFRSTQYGAAGLRAIYTPFKNFDVRLEGFMFKPLKEITLTSDNKLEYVSNAQNQYFIGSFTLVYDLNFTQVALNVNYYDNFNDNFPTNKPENYTFMFQLGFILFNEKMLE